MTCFEKVSLFSLSTYGEVFILIKGQQSLKNRSKLISLQIDRSLITFITENFGKLLRTLTKLFWTKSEWRGFPISYQLSARTNSENVNYFNETESRKHRLSLNVCLFTSLVIWIKKLNPKEFTDDEWYVRLERSNDFTFLI